MESHPHPRCTADHEVESTHRIWHPRFTTQYHHPECYQGAIHGDRVPRRPPRPDYESPRRT